MTKERQERIRQFRRDTSKKISMANKRIQRLKASGLYSPALERLDQQGIEKFSIRGKDYNGVQSELAKVNQFINADTSTIRGLNSTLKEMADNTGIKYNDLTDLQANAKPFFRLADRVEEYLRTVDNMASAVGYSKIWDAVNNYTTTNEIQLKDLKTSEQLDQLTKHIVDLIKEGERYQENDITWVKLPTD